MEGGYFNMNNWIAVKDEEPPDSTSVIVYAPNGMNQTKELIKQTFHMGGDYYYGDYSCRLQGVTHWMPMPKAPKHKE